MATKITTTRNGGTARVTLTRTPEIITTTPERRQVARVLDFDPRTAPHIDWNSIALTARELGAHFEARSTDNGAVTITMFWSYTDDEALIDDSHLQYDPQADNIGFSPEDDDHEN